MTRWLLLASLLLALDSKADTSWELSLSVYSSASHPDDPYATFKLTAQSAKDCRQIGEQGLRYFEGARLPDGSMSLPMYQCRPIP